MKKKVALVAVLLTTYFVGYTQIGHDVTGDRRPWSAEPLFSGDKVRFVVLADKTGGEQAGVFENAIPQINSQSADFIISVGDIIDGYTTNKEYLDRQWTEFEWLRSKLKSPYFYVGGNHDICNPWMEQQWIERYGRAYYFFTAQNNLFLVLNTDDQGRAGISEQQSTYFDEVIKREAKGRNIFVIMHRALWREAEGKMLGYENIEQSLEGYKYTVFCGHDHRYMKILKRGNPHYMLSTLGGGSSKVYELGEFDHFFVVETNGDKIDIKSISDTGKDIPLDVITEANIAEVTVLRDKEWMSVKPTIAPAQKVRKLETVLIFSNPGKNTLNVKGELPYLGDMGFNPKNIDFKVAPNSTDSIVLYLDSKELISLAELSSVELTLSGNYHIGSSVISAPSSVVWRFDYPRLCTDESLDVDCSKPGYIAESWDWKGVDDSKFKFKVSSDSKNVYVRIDAFDDVTIVDAPSIDQLHDKFIIDIAGEKTDEPFRLILSPKFGVNSPYINDIVGKCSVSKKHITGEVVIPKSLVGEEGFRLNVGFVDVDSPVNVKPSVLWWKPEWKSPDSYPMSGRFVFKK